MTLSTSRYSTAICTRAFSISSIEQNRRWIRQTSVVLHADRVNACLLRYISKVYNTIEARRHRNIRRHEPPPGPSVIEEEGNRCEDQPTVTDRKFRRGQSNHAER